MWTSPRKSLVKGERFIRFEEIPEHKTLLCSDRTQLYEECGITVDASAHKLALLVVHKLY
jgi:hypothetical protein